jgi:type III secretory pathway component EscR
MLKIPLGTTVKSFQIANSLTSLNQCNPKTSSYTLTLAASSRRFLLAPTTNQTNVYSQQERCFSNQRSSKTGFFQELVDNVKQGFEKNKELKQSIKQFREEAKKLEQSDALKEARSKFVSNF